MLHQNVLPTETEVRDLCFLARDILVEEGNIQCISTPITVSLWDSSSGLAIHAF
jgi:hypothetical protein